MLCKLILLLACVIFKSWVRLRLGTRQLKTKISHRKRENTSGTSGKQRKGHHNNTWLVVAMTRYLRQVDSSFAGEWISRIRLRNLQRTRRQKTISWTVAIHSQSGVVSASVRDRHTNPMLHSVENARPRTDTGESQRWMNKYFVIAFLISGAYSPKVWLCHIAKMAMRKTHNSKLKKKANWDPTCGSVMTRNT